MFKLLALVLAAIAVGAPSPAQEGYDTPTSTAMPPARYWNDAATLVLYVSDVTQFCGPAPEGYVKLGCTRFTKDGTPIIALPNPCAFPFDAYAKLTCHELGHRNGWGGNHER